MKHISIYYIKIVFIIFLSFSCSTQQVQQAIDQYSNSLNNKTQLSDKDISMGLKEALLQGTHSSIDILGSNNGYLNNENTKILFPPEIKSIEEKLRSIGMGALVDDFTKSLNKGAEMAVIEAKPILVDAIKSMSIQDAWNILKGDNKTAATDYLKKTSSDKLSEKFLPIIQSYLNKSNATKYYSSIIETYNKIPLVKKVETNLDIYATQKALDGIFFFIAKEELKIRENPSTRVTEILSKVFSHQD